MCRSFVNLCLSGLTAGYGSTGIYGTVLLCNGGSTISFEKLVHEVI